MFGGGNSPLGFGFNRMFRLPKHRQFDFKPRYYDAEKEELDQRLSSIKREIEREKRLENAESTEADRRAEMREQWGGRHGGQSGKGGRRMMWMMH